jgi:hypothetical protein
MLRQERLTLCRPKNRALIQQGCFALLKAVNPSSSLRISPAQLLPTPNLAS